jgi:hypothetical protein
MRGSRRPLSRSRAEAVRQAGHRTSTSARIVGLAARHRLSRSLGRGIEAGSITAHAVVFEALLQGATEAVAAGLKTHLE